MYLFTTHTGWNDYNYLPQYSDKFTIFATHFFYSDSKDLLAIANIIEIPFGLGGAVSGADLGIAALKSVAKNEESSLFEQNTRVDVEKSDASKEKADKYPYIHYGDKVLRTIRKTSDTVFKILSEKEFPIIIAGDHSTAAGTISGIIRAFPHDRIGVIWIDAHADLHSPYTSPSGNAHGMSLAIATGTDNEIQKRRSLDAMTLSLWEKLKDAAGKEKKLDIKDIVFVGGRAFDPEEKALINEFRNRNFTVHDVEENKTEVIVQEILRCLDHCNRIYVSFDVDSIDPSFSMGTGTPVEGGFDFEHIYKINELLVSDKKVCCWEMVEINPLLDYNNTMAKGCFKILKNVFKKVNEK